MIRRAPSPDAEINRGNVTRAAWDEWQYNASYGGIVPEIAGRDEPTPAFVDNELGFGFGSGPPLTLTLNRLSETNAHAATKLKADAPYRHTRAYHRRNKYQRQADLVAMRDAGMAARARGA
jgi:hypothetical protein